MGPKKARIARKRAAQAPSPDTPSPDTPVPSSDATPSPLQVRIRNKRARFSESPSRGPPRPVCTGVDPPFPTEQQKINQRYEARMEVPDHEERMDWYMEVATEKIKSVLRRANEDKLSKADLWELLTFGQHMYAGMKQQYSIDLNTALVERTVKNTAKGLTLLGQPNEFPWDVPDPRRCPACERVVVEDLDPLSPQRPWNRPPMTDAEIDDLNRRGKALGPDRCGGVHFGAWRPPRGCVV